MNISSRCEYACRAVVELAHHENSSEPVTALHIAESKSIPEKYLVHILLQLKRAGIVRSIRGAQGGYLLAQSPDEISLCDIVRAIDGPILDPLPVEDNGSRELASTWKRVAERIGGVLEETTVRDILDQSATGNMYYI